MMDRRFFLAALAATLPANAFAGVSSPVTRPVPRNVSNVLQASSRLLNPALANVTGFVLYDANSGALLDSYQPNLALPPASVTKAITAIYARQVLGPDYRFTTRVMITGPVEGGVVQGDMYLVGGGDPALDTDELASLAQVVAGAGIKGVTGGFYVDNSALPEVFEIDPTQPDYVGYNPSVSGLNLNFNRVYFEWKQAASGYNLTLDARDERYRPAVRWMDIRSENRGAPVFKYANNNGHDRWSVAESALGEGGGRWLPVRQSADYAGEVFTTLAAHMGVRLPAHKHRVVPRGATGVAQFSSEHLDEVLRWMLKYSNNMTAECLGLMASQQLGRRPRNLQDSASSMGRWARNNLGVSGGGFENHSGLTDRSRVTTSEMAGMLASPLAQAHLAGLLKPVNVYDTSGNVMNSSGIQVVAKTGTLNFTRGLAGYLSNGRRKYSFAIFAADLQKRRNIPMEQRERPRGARTWSSHAKAQEQALLRHWVGIIT